MVLLCPFFGQISGDLGSGAGALFVGDGGGGDFDPGFGFDMIARGGDGKIVPGKFEVFGGVFAVIMHPAHGGKTVGIVKFDGLLIPDNCACRVFGAGSGSMPSAPDW